jgi:hypothetical protein
MFKILFHGVWCVISVNIIQCTYTSFTSIAHHGVWVSVEFEFCRPIKLDNLTKLICFDYDQTLFEVVKIGTIIGL